MRVALGLTILLAAPVAAGELSLSFPLDCTLGQDCYIQQYADHDPGPGARDFTCGSLVYDGHKGTDFALLDLADLDNDIAVRAAADGIVRGVRNSMPDVLANAPGAPEVAGRECGNGLVIDHGDGWETQYCHLRQGSVRVKPGQNVQRGADLGRVGLSGLTQFPHLHLSVRKDGAVIDPFAPKDQTSCGPAPQDTLWDQPMPYAPGGWITAGFAPLVPEYSDIRAGSAPTNVASDPPALVLWGFAYGTQTGDVVEVEISGPKGPIHTRAIPLERTQAQMFRASGLRRPSTGWPAGEYVGQIRLIRKEQIISQKQLRATLG